MKNKSKLKFAGKYRFIKTNSKTGEVISISPWIKNLIMLDTATGVNLFIRRLANDLTYDCILTSAEIGTGATAPADTDANLVTPVVTGIAIADTALSLGSVLFSFFIPDGSLANGTYREFGLRCGAQMFARSLILPVYVKGSSEDTTIEYTITGSN